MLLILRSGAYFLRTTYSQNQNSEDHLSASDKKDIADTINRTFHSSQPIKPEDIQVDSGRPTNLKQSTPQILTNVSITESPKIAQARSYCIMKVVEENGHFVSTLVVHKSANPATTIAYPINPTQVFQEYGFSPILSSDATHAFFSFGRNDSERDGHGLYVINLNTGVIDLISKQYAFDNDAVASDDQRYIAYTMRVNDKSALYIYDYKTRSSTHIIDTDQTHIDYRWQNKVPVLAYSVSKVKPNGKLTQSRCLLFDARSNTTSLYRTDCLYAAFFDENRFCIYMNDAANKVFLLDNATNLKKDVSWLLKLSKSYIYSIAYDPDSESFFVDDSPTINDNGAVKTRFSVISFNYKKSNLPKLVFQTSVPIVSEVTFPSKIAVFSKSNLTLLTHFDNNDSSSTCLILQKKSGTTEITELKDIMGMSVNFNNGIHQDMFTD